MNAVPASDVPALWDAYVERHPRGWFWHTAGWREYQREYFRGEAEDLSFVVLDVDGRVVAAVPLFFLRGEFAWGRALPEPLYSSAAVRSWVEDHVASLARARGARRWFYERQAAPGQESAFRRRVVDLDDLSWSSVRSSYRSLIHRAEREYEIRNASGEDEDAVTLFAAYQALHRRMNPAQRSDATYGLQGRWFREGKGAVVVARQGGITWGASYWFAYKDEAYYGSAAYAVRDVSHATTWRMLLALRAAGVKRACLGYLGEAATDKERSIEFYKTGFSGRDEPFLRVSEEYES